MGRSTTGRYPIEWLLPIIVLVVFFTAYPIAHTIWTSLHRDLVILPGKPFVGLANFQSVITSNYFLESLGNTVLLVVTSVPLILVLGFGTARLLMARFYGRGVVRSVVILPWVLPPATAGIVWVWMFNGTFGIVNMLMAEVGLIDEYINWLNDPWLAKLTVLVGHTWIQFPFAAILFMAALTTIDPVYYEAAQIDGANRYEQFRYITFPQIKPMIVVLMAYQTIQALTQYDLTYSLTAGGPGTSTSLLAYHIYRENFMLVNFGNGAALALIMVVITLVFIRTIIKAIPFGLFVEE